jgi:cyclopropane fatty-acyl-phospholipid synthase-like methyltransferase
MTEFNRQDHWQNVYREKGEYQVSWFQEQATASLELIGELGIKSNAPIIDIGGGASRLVDALGERGYLDLTVLDLSDSATSIAKERLGERAAAVHWIVSDVTRWQPSRQYDLWHDRAAFHFLTEAADRNAYIKTLTAWLRTGGHAIIATFAMDGPERCSGLPVVRYDAARLSAALGPAFVPVKSQRHDHTTPWGAIQRFQFGVFRRV